MECCGLTRNNKPTDIFYKCLDFEFWVVFILSNGKLHLIWYMFPVPRQSSLPWFTVKIKKNPSLHITQMKFEMLALFCKYFTRRAYLFNFYERKLTPKIYLSCFYSDNAFLFIHHYIFICLPLYCFNIHAYQIPHLFFFVPNVKINPMLNYPLLIRVNFCLVHL